MRPEVVKELKRKRLYSRFKRAEKIVKNAWGLRSELHYFPDGYFTNESFKACLGNNEGYDIRSIEVDVFMHPEVALDAITAAVKATSLSEREKEDQER